MSNTINSFSPSIRDFLLNRNLILSDSITNNGLSALASGLGYPVDINSLPPNVQPSVDIMTNGPLYLDLNQLNNVYSSTNGDELINIQTTPFNGNLPIGTTQLEYPDYIASEHQNSNFSILNDLARNKINLNKYITNKGYIDKNNELNINGSSSTAINFIGSLLNTNSNFDIRSTLAGRILGASGGINDTPLGIIGGQQLLKSLTNKTISNIERETLGQLNLNPISLLTGHPFINPNYSITVGKTTGKKILDIGLNILGFENPTSNLFERESSIFYNENPTTTKLRVDSQIKNTGNGQITSLFSSIKQNKYRIRLEDDRIKDKINEFIYLYDDKNGGIVDFNDKLNHLSENINKNEGLVRSAGFQSLNGLKIGDSDFVWSDNKLNKEPINLIQTLNTLSPLTNSPNLNLPNSVFTNEDTLLGKTQALFNSNLMKTLVSGHGEKISSESNSEITTYANVGSERYISKGSQVLSKSAIDGVANEPEDVFCRTWTPIKRYNTVSNLQKHSGLKNNVGLRNRQTTELSVLDNNGFIRIAPNIGDDKGVISNTDSPVNIKRFMFSLENLAWSGDDYKDLPPSERGPGDPLTGTKGRIMWFPPYGLNFSEGTSLNWDSHSFIGRGEPVYTYNNSERSGSLQFKVIIDHASYMNDLKGNSNNDLFASIASGCYDFDLDKIKNLTQNEKNKAEVVNVVPITNIEDTKQIIPESFTIYFPNDVASMSKFPNYELLGDVFVPEFLSLNFTTSDGFTSKVGEMYPDEYDYGLNKLWNNQTFINKLKSDLKSCPSCRIDIGGFASTDGNNDGNSKLIKARAEEVKKWFINNIIPSDDLLGLKRFASVEGKRVTGCAKDSAPVDALCKKQARRADISFIDDPKLKEANIQAQAEKEKIKANQDLANNIKSRFFNEALYFQKLEQENKVIFDSLGEKIKYFHPAFHSITPEGFNSRLNFLEQCTRAGSTKKSGNPNNLVFGMAPVLILRIGDFYHTKIILENLDIDFDSGNGVQWDLNPEGVGVQPMIANINMSFKFIGGHSLQGPINKLQNAISYNFFANTEIYDPRADYIKVTNKVEYKNDIDKGDLFSILNKKNIDSNNLNKATESNQIKVAENSNK
jgi:hypothetical protein